MHTAPNPFRETRTGPYPRDLRGGGPNLAGAGKLYPVKPAAAARLRAYWQQQAAAAESKKGATTMSSNPKNVIEELRARQRNQDGHTAVPATHRPRVTQAIDPTETYPAHVVRAAAAEAAKDGRRNLRDVLTDEVLAIWHQWNANGGKTMDWIAEHNGLLELNGSQVSKYLRKYRKNLKAKPAVETNTAVASPIKLAEEPIGPAAQTAAAPQPAPKDAPNTAASPPDPAPEPQTATMEAGEEPEFEPMETAVEPFAVERPENLPSFFDREYRPPRPSPGAALATLAALIDNEQLRVKGSVKLNLEIEFGE